MLYLEDFVELIESLPQRLRDRFTEMREADLTVQNNVDEIDKRIKTFFSNAKKMKASDREAEHKAIMSQYDETLKVADDKVALANDMYEVLQLYIKRLDQDINSFKNELEDDNKGITDLLEKRSLELDQKSVNSSQKENRYSFTSSRSRDNHSHSRSEKRRDSNASSTSVEKRGQGTIDKVSTTTVAAAASSGGSLQDSRPSSANSGALVGQSASAMSSASVAANQPAALANSVSSVGYSLGHIGAGGNAIAAAASQAIAATQHMQQGRRTASLKASYEAINTGGVHAAEFSRELAGAAQTAIAAIQESSKKNKKKVSSASVPNASVIAAQQSLQQQQQHQQQQQQQAHHAVQQHHQQQSSQQQHHHQHHQQQAVQAVQVAAGGVAQTSVSTKASSAAAAAAAVAAAAAAAAATSADQTAAVTETDWPVDPNEPRYCICNQVSYGDMVACDNSNCPFEWFHYPCVNITAPPEGEWYCPQCAPSMKRRSNRKN